MAKLKKRVNQPLLSTTKQYGLGLFILLSALVFSLFFIWEVSAQPFVVAKSKALKVATEHAQLKEANQVQIYNGTQTFFSVGGINQNEEAVWVFVPEKGTTIYVYPQDSGITSEKAQLIAQENGANQVDRVLLGIEEEKPVWEVKSGTAYYFIEFETGIFMKKEGL